MPITRFVSHYEAPLTTELCEQHGQAWHFEANALCAGSMPHHGLTLCPMDNAQLSYECRVVDDLLCSRASLGS